MGLDLSRYPTPLTRLRRVVSVTVLLLVVGVLMTDVADGLPAIDPPALIAWVICVGVFALSDLSVGPLQSGRWAGFFNSTSMIAWLALGFSAGLAVIVIGALAAASIRVLVLLAQQQESPIDAALVATGDYALGRMTITTAALVAAGATFDLLGITFPAQEQSLAFALGLLAVLIVNFVAAEVIGRLLVVGAPGVKQTSFDLLLREGVPLIVIPALALTYLQSGVVAFAALMALLTVQVLRFRQVEQAQNDLRRRVSELATLSAVGDALNLDMDSDESLWAIYRRVAGLVKVSAFIVALYEDNRSMVNYRFVVVDGERQPWLPRPIDGNHSIDYVLREQRMLHVNAAELQAMGLRVMHDFAPAHLLVLPLLVGERPLGALLVANRSHAYPFSDEEVAVMQTIAGQMSLAIRTRTLDHEHDDLARSVAQVNEALGKIIFSLDRDQALHTTGDLARKIVRAQKAALVMIDDEADTVDLVYTYRLDPLHERALQQDRALRTLLTAPTTRVITDVAELEAGHPLRELAQIGGFAATIQVPLQAGTLINGALLLYFDRPHPTDITFIRLLETLAYQAMAALDNAELLKSLEIYAAEQSQLVHLSRISTASLVMTDLVAEVSDLLRQMLGVDHVAIFLTGGTPETLDLVSERSRNGYSLSLNAIPELALMRSQEKPNPRIFYREEQRDGHISQALYGLMDWREAATLVLLPLVANETLQGMITLHIVEERAFSDSEWRLAEMAANQVATQFHNAQLYEETQRKLERRLQELSLIETLAQNISSAPTTDKIIHNVLDSAAHATSADLASLALLTERGDDLRIIGTAFDGHQWQDYEMLRAPDDGIVGRVIRSGEAQVIVDNDADPDYVRRVAAGEFRSSLVVPIYRDNRVAGALNVESRETHHFQEDHRTFLTNLAGHASISIQNIELHLERQNRIETLTLLRDMAIRLATDVENDSVIHAVLVTAIDLVQGEHAVLYHVDATSGRLDEVGVVKMSSEPDLRATTTTLVPRRVAQQALESGTVVVIEDVAHSAAFHDFAALERITYTGMLAAPIKRGSRVSEVLCVTLSRARPYTEADRDAIELLAIQAAGHLENASLYQRIRSDDDRRRAILNSARDGILMLDRDGILIEANASSQTILGIDVNEFKGQHFARTLMQAVGGGDFADGEREESITEALREMARVLRLDPQRITTRSFEIRQGGAVRYIDEVGSPVVDRGGEIVGRLLTLRDVTDDRLLAAYRDEISSMVHHDLRSPLGSIYAGMSYIKSLLAEEDEDAKFAAAAVVEGLISSAEHLMGLVDNLLDIAKLETRRMPLKLGPTRLKDLAQNVHETLGSAIQEAGVTVDIAIPDDLPPVNADSEKIRRVMINLLDNAVRYTPANTTVQIGAGVEGDKVKLYVADSGTGIPPDARDRVFEKFMQIKENKVVRGSKGSGLGLTFCKLVLEAHGEAIWVEPVSPMPGASFAFTLPICENGAAPPTDD